MRKIDIHVNKAKLKKYTVTIGENRPEVTATIELYSGEKRISEFTLSTETWFSQHFDLPIGVIEPILKIAKELEVVITHACQASLAVLPAPKKS